MSSFNPPDLDALRKQSRDDVKAALQIGAALLPKSPLRVMSDGSAGLAFLVLLYLQNVADNLLPDKANLTWLTRWANIFLTDGPKAASFAAGTISLTGSAGTVVEAGAVYQATVAGTAVQIETTADTTLGSTATSAAARVLTAGSIGNLDAGTLLSAVSGIQGVDASATVVSLTGGVDAETADELRVRVLDRIQKPPMGGDADDYVAWALSVPGVTRAWCSPGEMGPGTVTVRFMMDDLRQTSDPTTSGFPTADDVATVKAFLDTVRPVAVKDLFVFGPKPLPIDLTVTGLSPNNGSTQAAVTSSVVAMLSARAAPARSVNGIRVEAQTIWGAWLSEAVLNASGVDHCDADFEDRPMPYGASLAVPGAITFA